MDASDGTQVLATFGDLQLVGTVFRGGNFTGQGQLRVVGGFGGWRRTVRARAYANALGLKAAQIVSDVASEVGERMASPAPGTVGVRWVRLSGTADDPAPACRTLQILCPRWWVGYDGLTNPGARPGGQMTASLNVIQDETSLSDGSVVCAPDLLASVLPGASFTTPTVAGKVATMVIHRVRAEQVRTEIWTR